MNDLNTEAEIIFTDTFTSELSSINQELTDSTIKVLLDDDIISNLPIVKFLIGIAKAGLSVKDYFFTRKVLKFLLISSEIPLDKRKKFVNKIKNDKKYRTKVGETCLNLIEKARDTENAEQIAYLSNACMNEELSYDDFIRCANIITTISSGSLRDFVLLEKEKISETSMDELLYSGLYRIYSTPVTVKVRDEEELKQQEELNKTQQLFSIRNTFDDILFSLNKQFDEAIHKTFPFSSLPPEINSKYHTKTDGSNINYYTSEIGKIIKKVLKNYYQ